MKNRIVSESWGHYELIDAGGGKKLERWGEIITIRPEVNAYFQSGMPFSEWNKMAHFHFLPTKGVFGKWKNLKNAPIHWNLIYQNLKFQIHLTETKHTGIFPEQKSNWDFIQSHIKEGQRFLNLFGYSGASSIIAKSANADVFHVDSSKSALNWARQNQELNKLLNSHWVHEDAMLFLQREVKRNRKYHAIQMDPPAWGNGLKGSKWKLEEKLDELVSNASKALEENAILILTTYSPNIEPSTLKEIFELYLKNCTIETGILCTKTRTGKILEHGSMARAIKSQSVLDD